MRVLRTLTILLGAFAVLATGLVPQAAAASAAEAPPACHETASHHQAPQGPFDPADPIRVADCCIACVTTPPLQPPAGARPAAPQPATFGPPIALPAGERPAPEPHPPRLLPD